MIREKERKSRLMSNNFEGVIKYYEFRILAMRFEVLLVITEFEIRKSNCLHFDALLKNFGNFEFCPSLLFEAASFLLDEDSILTLDKLIQLVKGV